MYPTLLDLPRLGITVPSFGAMMCIAFGVAYVITRKNLKNYGIAPALSINILIFVMAGGVLGSKAYYAVDMSIREGGTLASYFWGRAGMTWYGGLIGAVLASYAASAIYRFRLSSLLNTGAPAVAIGQAIGRIGCFLNGDDYGVPSDLPWAIAFPLGQPPVHHTVHPTQLYEAMWLFVCATLLSKRRQKSPSLFAEYLIANGLGRVAIETLRVNPPGAMGLTQPQWIGIALVGVGVGLRANSKKALSRKLSGSE